MHNMWCLIVWAGDGPLVSLLPFHVCCSSLVISLAEHLEHLHVSDCVFDFRTASSPDRAEQKIRGSYWGGNEGLWRRARCQQNVRVTGTKGQSHFLCVSINLGEKSLNFMMNFNKHDPNFKPCAVKENMGNFPTVCSI